MRFTHSRLGLLLVAALLVLTLPAQLGAMGVLAVGVATQMSHLDELMKIIYSEPVIVDIVTDSELMDLFQEDMNVRTDETTGGKYVQLAHYIRLAGAAGARAENDYIPVPQAAQGENSRINLKKLLGVIEMTGDVMDRVVGDEGAFIDYMERALPDVKTRVVNEIDRMYVGFGAGIKAKVGAIVDNGDGTATITLTDALGVTGYEDAWLQFLEGETLVFSATADGAALRNAGVNQAVLVDNIIEDQDQIQVTGAPATLAAITVGDFIFSGDAAGANTQLNGENREISGLLAGVDDGGIVATYNGITRANRRFWNARVFDLAGPPYDGKLTEKPLMVAFAQLATTANAKPDVLVGSMHMPIGYWEDLKGDRVLNDPRSYTGGASGFQIIVGDRTLKLKTARKLPPQIAFLLSTNSWRRFTLKQWEWVSRGGSIWNIVTDAQGRKDSWFAFGKMREELACVMPRQNLRFEGLTRAFTY